MHSRLNLYQRPSGCITSTSHYSWSLYFWCWEIHWMLCGRCPGRTCRRRNIVGKGWGCFWLLRSLCLFLLGQYDGRPSAKVTEVRNIEFCTASSAYSAFGWRAEYYKKPPKAIAKRRVSNPFLSQLKLFVHRITQPQKNRVWRKKYALCLLLCFVGLCL